MRVVIDLHPQLAVDLSLVLRVRCREHASDVFELQHELADLTFRELVARGSGAKFVLGTQTISLDFRHPAGDDGHIGASV